jgi:hypothetical protein
MTAEPAALFVSYGAGHIAKVAPVIRELRLRGVACTLIALTTAFEAARDMGLNPLGYKDLTHLLGVEWPAAQAHGHRLAIGNSHPQVSAEETVAYMGINFWDQVTQLGLEAAQAAYDRRGRQGFMPVAFMQRAIAHFLPDVVVATSTPRTEEAAIRAAVLASIPSLTMVDLFAPPSDPFLSRPVHADRICVVTPEVRTRFLAAGLGAAQVVVTGSPDFDELLEPHHSRAARDFLDARGWQGLDVVLWAGILEPPGTTYAGTQLGQQVEAALIQWVLQNENAAAIFRYHPNQHQHFKDLERPKHPRIHLAQPLEEAIGTQLHVSNCVIHQVSTVGFQAAVLGKRVMHLSCSDWVAKADFDLSALGPSEAIPTPEALVAALGNAKSSKIRGISPVQKKSAASQVADEIARLISRSKKL